jgi:CENP-Q, a CENPA-CAD centromere complex subunit
MRSVRSPSQALGWLNSLEILRGVQDSQLKGQWQRRSQNLHKLTIKALKNKLKRKRNRASGRMWRVSAWSLSCSFLFLILVEHPESELVKRRRFEKLPSQDQDTPEGDEVPLYQHLQAVTRKVSLHIIDAKWEPLPSGCVERISQFLQDLQRPVVIRYNDERKKTQSSTALQMISRRLVSKVSKGLPFPQGTRNHREDDFDFEKILDHNRALEAQLTPALHANELLEAQVSKELACLEFEQETLVRLEANAKTEAGLRSEAARRLHSLLQPQDGIMDIEELKDDVGLTNAQVPLLLDHSVSILVPWCQL